MFIFILYEFTSAITSLQKKKPRSLLSLCGSNKEIGDWTLGHFVVLDEGKGEGPSYIPSDQDFFFDASLSIFYNPVSECVGVCLCV